MLGRRNEDPSATTVPGRSDSSDKVNLIASDGHSTSENLRRTTWSGTPSGASNTQSIGSILP